MPGLSVACMTCSIVPVFLFLPMAELYLLIPVVLLETFIIQSFLKLPFKQVIFNCLAANCISTICTVIVCPLEIISYAIIPLCILLVLPLSVIGFGISYYVERTYYLWRWKEQDRGLVSKATFSANLYSYCPTLLLMIFLSTNHSANRMERPMRISCSSNLKQISLGIVQYALDYNNFLPNGHGSAGLETLRSNNYVTDHKIYTCPSASRADKVKAGKDNASLTEETVSYLYFGEGLTNAASPDSPIACDKPDNHKNYGNVLFIDGHVQGFSGANWMEQANIPEKERAK